MLRFWTLLFWLPSCQGHHPFYFAIDTDSYVGMGHYSNSIERDWYRYDSLDGTWNREEDFASYALDTLLSSDEDSINTDMGIARTSLASVPITTEARVA